MSHDAAETRAFLLAVGRFLGLDAGSDIGALVALARARTYPTRDAESVGGPVATLHGAIYRHFDGYHDDAWTSAGDAAVGDVGERVGFTNVPFESWAFMDAIVAEVARDRPATGRR